MPYISSPPPPKKRIEYDMADWSFCHKELSENEICVATKDEIITSIQDDMEDKDKDYLSLTYKL